METAKRPRSWRAEKAWPHQNQPTVRNAGQIHKRLGGRIKQARSSWFHAERSASQPLSVRRAGQKYRWPKGGNGFDIFPDRIVIDLIGKIFPRWHGSTLNGNWSTSTTLRSMTEIPMIDSFPLLKRQFVCHRVNQYYIYLVVHVPLGEGMQAQKAKSLKDGSSC